jgi:tetratricopeptide (TPR) repeat protein
MNRDKLFIRLLILAVFIIPSLVFPYKKIKCFVLEPPGQLLPNVKRIAVLDFESTGGSETDNILNWDRRTALRILTDVMKDEIGGKKPEMDYGRQFGDNLISLLVQKDRGIQDIKTGFLGMGSKREGKSLQEGTFTNIYDIAERSQLLKIIEEQKLSAAGFVNDDQLVQLGNMLGVQAFLMGSLNYSNRDSDYQENREKKQNGKKVTEKVPCQRREVQVSVRARIISAETGQVLGSTESSKQLKKESCRDSYTTLPSLIEMMDTVIQAASTDVANYIAPHFEQQNYEMAKLKGDKYKDKGDKAAELAENYDIDEAYVIYKAIVDQDPYNPEALYNVGIVNEVVGNYQKAQEYYNMALQLKDEGDYQKGLRRVDKMVSLAQSLAQIGIEIKEHSFQASESAVARAVAQKVKTKGNRDDRIPVYAQPNSQDAATTQVPGDITFTVLKKEGDWYLIQLLGGSQGYVHKDKVEEQ